MSGSHLSKDFFELVKAIGESKSKQEEDRIIMNEVGVLKRKMPEATVGRKKMKEFLVRMIYVEMLGHDASFGYIKAVELTASQNLSQKRSGYLTAALTLSPTHEFRFMLVNQMQRDLSSSNMLEAAAALTALCKLATVDMIPAVMTEVVRLLKHDKELVRKKAVMVLHRMHQLDPSSVSHMGDHLRRMLCDKDPSVMGAALCLLHDLARADAANYKDLVPSFVSILKQITEHRLPRDFDYHRMPAPWIQMRLLRILALLGRADRTASEGMYEVLMDVMRRADTGINVGYAIVYECVRTVTTIYPNSSLLDAAAASISRFISAWNYNLKYVGVTGLAAIVKDHPKYAQEHQMAVIDCLVDPDETLKRKTLDLLYTMTNPVNVEFIAEKLLSFLEKGNDSFWRRDLVKRITQCAERFAPSNSWYVRIMTRVFRAAGDMVKPEVAHNLMQLIAEGSGEDEEADLQLRRDAVNSYLGLLDTPAIPDQLMQVMAWVLGEYGSLVSSPGGLRKVSAKLCDVATELSFRDPHTCGFVVTALMKLSAQSGEVSPPVAHLLTLYSQSRHSELQQRCLEFLQLAREGPAAMAAVLPVDASCEDVEADENLSHLDSIVAAALAAGAVGYSPPAEAEGDSDEDEVSQGGGVGSSLNLTPYARPSQPSIVSVMSASAAQAPLPPPQSSGGGAGTPPSTADIFASGPRLRPVSKVWGRPKPGEQPPSSAAKSETNSSTAPAGSSSLGTAAAGGPGSSSGAGYYGSGSGAYGGSQSAAGSASSQPMEDPQVAAQRAQKEQMAAMLFGGVSAGASGAGTRRLGAAATEPRSGDLRSARETPRSSQTDASSGTAQATGAPLSTSRAPPAASTTPTHPSLPMEFAGDLLDLQSMGASLSNGVGDGGRSGTGGAIGGGLVSATEHQHPSSSVNHLGLDLLGGGSASSSSANGSSSQAVPIATETPPLGDLLGGATRVSGGAMMHHREPSSNGIGSGGGGTGGDALLNGNLGSGGLIMPARAQPMAGRSGVAGDGGLDLSGLMLGPITPGLMGGAVSGVSSPAFTYASRTMQPLVIATEEFARRWTMYKGERRAPGNKLPSSFGSLQAVAERLRDRLGVHKVETIPHTAEGICAGQLEGVGATVMDVCLVHYKVWSTRGTVDLTVRAGDVKLAEAALAFARTALTLQ